MNMPMTVWRALSTASSLLSTTTTGKPPCAKAIAMPLPIVPAPTTPTFATSGVILSLSKDAGVILSLSKDGNLIQLPFREEHVAQRRRGRRSYEFVEEPMLTRESERKRQLDRRLHRVDQLVRGESAAILGRHHLVRLRDDERPRLRGHVGGDRRRHRRGAPFHRTVCGERFGARDDVVLDDFIDDPEFERALGLRRGAFEHELERRPRADQPREPLRRAGARQQPKFDLRQSRASNARSPRDSRR